MKLQFILECLTFTSSRAGGALQGGVLQLTSPSWSPALRRFLYGWGQTSGSCVWWRSRTSESPRRSSAWPPRSLYSEGPGLSEPDRTVQEPVGPQKKAQTVKHEQQIEVRATTLLVTSSQAETWNKVFFVLWSDRRFVCKRVYRHTIESDKMQGVFAILHRWSVRSKQCMSLWF